MNSVRKGSWSVAVSLLAGIWAKKKQDALLDEAQLRLNRELGLIGMKVMFGAIITTIAAFSTIQLGLLYLEVTRDLSYRVALQSGVFGGLLLTSFFALFFLFKPKSRHLEPPVDRVSTEVALRKSLYDSRAPMNWENLLAQFGQGFAQGLSNNSAAKRNTEIATRPEIHH